MLDTVMAESERLLVTGTVPPIVYALYTSEVDHFTVVEAIQIERVKKDAKGGYTYPGISKLGYYPKRGNGRWFSGTLVIGDGLDLEQDDKSWMIRDEMFFRIKAHKDSSGFWDLRTYVVEVSPTQLNLI